MIELKGEPEDVAWVVQLSDLHFSVHHPERALDFKAIVGPALAMVNPSLVFITGDLTGNHLSFIPVIFFKFLFLKLEFNYLNIFNSVSVNFIKI